jgi:small subunit ribosomal protein S1
MVGELIEATITKLTNYGAFARVNDEYELEGLIHISELASERIEHPREIVERGDIVALRIIKLDSTQRQMGLSIKQAISDEYLESDLALAESMESE